MHRWVLGGPILSRRAVAKTRARDTGVGAHAMQRSSQPLYLHVWHALCGRGASIALFGPADVPEVIHVLFIGACTIQLFIVQATSCSED
jgi:hypothetical protein